MNPQAQRRANLLSNVNILLMILLTFSAGILSLLGNPDFGLFLFMFVIIRIGFVLFTNTRWVVSPGVFLGIVGIILGNVITKLIMG